MREHAMLEGTSGIAMVALWGMLQFVRGASNGTIHILLALGVVLILRGIVTSRWGTPPAR
jgi:hypothetical protein